MLVADCEVLQGSTGGEGPVVYVIDMPEHPLPVAEAATGLGANVVRIPVAGWADALTPWPAPALRAGQEGFGGRADQTLADLQETVRRIERSASLRPSSRAICGYSLSGLFALYAFVREPVFSACASVSGSLWYEGWVGWLRANAPDCAERYAYLSVGRKEKRAGLPFSHVEDDLAACADILRKRGCTVDVVLGSGNHVQYQRERLAAALTSLDCAWGDGAALHKVPGR